MRALIATLLVVAATPALAVQASITDGNTVTLSGATYEDGDLDADGDVDLSDLALLLANFGAACP